MNRPMYLYIIGCVLNIVALLMLPAGAVSVYYEEHGAVIGFAIAIALMLILGISLIYKRPENKAITGKGGLRIVALCWVTVSLFGAIPYYFSDVTPSLVDALFESVSGFTTTAATVVPDLESTPRGILLWRNTTQWLGGMGVLIIILSVVPLTGGHFVHLIQAEFTGPSSIKKFAPRVKSTAIFLYCVYIALTVAAFLFLYMGGMPLFDSVAHALATLSTGGVGVKNDSVGAYGNLYFEVVIMVFMLLAGINFRAFFLMYARGFKAFFRSEELRVYLGITAVGILFVTLNLYQTIYPTILSTLRYASFQVVGATSTTVYTTTDIGQWPAFSRHILFFLMLSGASSGSTGAGLKIARIIIIYKMLKMAIRRMLHPHVVDSIRFEGQALDGETLTMVNVFLFLYVGIFIASMILVSLDGHNFETTFSAVLSCISNIGPTMEMITSPAGSYDIFSPFSKVVLMLNMLFGRLEIFPMLMLLLGFRAKEL